MELRVEQLVGRKVRALDGRVVARIEDFVVVRRGQGRELTEIHLGPAALIERLSAPFVSRCRGWSVRWEQIDFSDPMHPTLKVPLSEIMPLDPS